MSISTGVVSIAAIACALVAAQLLSQRVRLPTPTLQFLLGAGLTNAVVAMGYDTGLRFQNFHDLVFYLFLPVVVFSAARIINFSELKQHLTGVLTMAVLGLLGTTAVAALLLYVGMGHPQGFPWVAAVLTACLLAATDPAAVTSQAWIHHVQPRLALVLEGESLFNDATAVVLFTVVLSVALTSTTQGAEDITLHALGVFGQELGGGLLIGMAFALLYRLLNHLLDRDTDTELWLALGLALGAYHLSLTFHASGVIACLLLGLYVGHYQRTRDHSEGEPDTTAAFWQVAGNSTNGALFVLMGATVTMNMFTERWLAMLIGIGAVLVARMLSTQVLLAWQPFTQQGWASRYTLAERTLTGGLGMRGAITIALVLILPVDLPYWWTIQSIAYGVVLFDLFITAPLMPVLLKSQRLAG